MSYSIVGTDGKEYGPVELPVLQQWAREGRIAPITIIINKTTGQRSPASGMAEVQCFIPSSSSIPPIPGASVPIYAPTYGPVVGPDGRPLKSKVTAGLLGIFLGSLGVHRFYLGYTGIGIVMLLITVVSLGFGGFITGIWGLVEGIMCLTGSMNDSEGRPLCD